MAGSGTQRGSPRKDRAPIASFENRAIDQNQFDALIKVYK
jgi:hypothetical protein